MSGNRRRRATAVAGVLAMVVAATLALGVSSAEAATASDPGRADFSGSPANAVTCAQVGFPDSLIASADDNDPIVGVVSGVVVPNTSSISPGQGEMVNVDDPPAGVVIDAVVVKGGPAFNVYSTSSGSDNGNHVPPDEDTPTEYISPRNNGGNIPAVSHWFICYHGETPPPDTATLAVTKEIVPFAGPGTPLSPIPTTFTVEVTCSDGSGGILVLEAPDDLTGIITGIEPDATCNVEETSLVPLGTTVTYDPAAAGPGGAGVPVDVDEPIEIIVTNDFEGVQVSPGVVTPTQPAASPAAAVAASPRLTG